MNSNSQTEVVIPLAKDKLVLVTIGAVVFVALCVWIWSIAASYKPSDQVMVRAVGIVGASFFGLCAVWGLIKLFDTRAGLIIDDRGIVDNSSALAAGRVLWDEIESFAVSGNFIVVFVADPRKFVSGWNPLSRLFRAANRVLTGSPVVISSSLLASDPELLAEELIEAFEKHNGTARLGQGPN